uniref:Uncharacterized protein n=1 Tax=Vannella robusta TaxID=1487602 RepID=A0A7S4HTA2_9EUKA
MGVLRDAMRKRSLQAFIIPSSDAHMSEYICEADMQREFISGFTGSNGTAVVTTNKAALWTDGRYFLQASQQLSSDWTLMKSGLPDTPSISKWLLGELSSGSSVGFEGSKNSYGSYKKWKKELSKDKENHLELISVSPDFFDSCWPDRPSYPKNPVFVHPLKYSGQPTSEKLANARKEMEKKKAELLVVSALDEIAWLLNIRGSDISYNPVALSYVIVTPEEVFWFIAPHKLSDEVREHLKDLNITYKGYEELFTVLRDMSGRRVWVDPACSNSAIYQEIPEEFRISDHSPLSIPKAIKNEVEQQGLRDSCLRDSAAIVEYLAWLEHQLKEGAKITEFEGSMKLLEFRQKQDRFVDVSFATISGSGPNGAIIHYHATQDHCSIIDHKNLYLCDSGAQYYDGTTDVTRTVHYLEPTAHEKRCFTRVLQGHIDLASTIFPKGTEGRMLDPIARLPLWKDGLEYRHGTGHGVGSFLNVHEPPTLISSSAGNRGAYFSNPFKPGMTVTIEPGYYEDGAFGIRIENDYLITEAETPNHFEDLPFYTFENLTWVPIQPSLVNSSLLSTVQRKWLNEYNQRCKEKLAPLLSDELAIDYVTRNTLPIE